MLDHLSNYPSPNLPEAVSEVNKSIQLLNEPKKIFLFKDSYISEKIENYISSQTEKAWITKSNNNPYTRLYSKYECELMFKKFSR